MAGVGAGVGEAVVVGAASVDVVVVVVGCVADAELVSWKMLQLPSSWALLLHLSPLW